MSKRLIQALHIAIAVYIASLIPACACAGIVQGLPPLLVEACRWWLSGFAVLIGCVAAYAAYDMMETFRR